ncbi:MAG: calcium-binding protein, partial [Gammaproteobacteria bacterium]
MEVREVTPTCSIVVTAETVSDWDASGSDIDVVQFGPDIAPSDVRITRDAYHLYLEVDGTSDRLTLLNYFYGAAYRIDQVKFADGTLWTDLESRITWADPTSNADTVYGSLRDDMIDGLEGNDTSYGEEGNDTLSGGGGADIVFGGAGDDTLDGGAGNDALNGGESYYGYAISNGNDTYLFGRGSGQDVIFDNDLTAGNRDTVQMAPDVLPSDVRLTRDYQNLYLSIDGTTDSLTLQSWFVDDAHKVEQVRFADGTLWNISTLVEKSRISSEIDDMLIGDGNEDVINGLGGNDLLDGQGGNDTLDGGAGDDTLAGGTGADTYRFGRGYGQDVITEVHETTAGVVDTVQLAADIAPADITVTKYGYDLHLNIVGTSDRLTLRNWLNGTNYRVEEVRFVDGTVWNGATLETLAAQAGIAGTAGNDSLTGTSGDDSIQGAGGNDTVYGYGGRDVLDGGSGNDTLYAASSAGGLDSGDEVYLFGRGSGRDTVYDYDTTAGNTDVIRLAADVLPSDVMVWRNTNDLHLSIGAVTGSEDRIAISNWFTNSANRIERIEFADGTVWDATLLAAAPILGSSGNDYLYGTAGDDLFDGGAGNDTLYGYNSSYGTGNDTYLFKRGNGQDTVVDYDTAAGNLDTIRAVGLLPSEVTLGRDTSSLILKINGTTDQVTVQNWFANPANRVERVVFDDGTVWDVATLAAAPILGTSGNDYLYGTAGDDLFDGGAGNDALYGYNSSYGTGNDTYLFKRGNGQDTVVDYDTAAGNLDTIRAVGLLPSEVTLGRDTYNLILKINGTIDQMTVNNWFANTANRVERVVFDDGTVWDTTTLAAAPILGASGNDYLYGTAGDDLFDGGAGNDMLYGYTNGSYDSGNDTYLFGVGAGQDTLSDYGSATGNVDTVKIVGKLPSEISVSRRVDQSGNLTNDLVLKITGTTDQLTLQNYFVAGGAYKVEKVQFDDGTMWDMALLGSAAIMGTAVANTLSGSADADLIQGLEGNDTLSGNAGNDIMQGGADNDTISDTSGNNLFDGGAGMDILTGGSGKE